MPTRLTQREPPALVDVGQRTLRISAVMADVVERMRQDAAAQLRAQRGHTLPARRARINLLHAAVVGPVLTDMYIAARPLGDG